MHVSIIGAPVDLGASRRGTDMGPSAIRAAKLQQKLENLGHTVTDLGNIHTPTVEAMRVRDKSLLYMDEIVRICEELADMVAKEAAKDRFPLVLGGDHSIAMGTTAGITRAKKKIGIIWMDAHGDFNTPATTETGNIHGMPFAAILGYGSDKVVNLAGISPKAVEKNAVLIGARALDKRERELLKNSKVTVFTMRDIDEMGIKKVMEEAAEIASKGVKHVHLSFDMDLVDPSEAPGTGTPVHGGLTFREAHLAMELLADTEVVTSMDLVELNPLMDVQNRTGDLAVGLITSALGKKIL
ncbi:MAG: arginase [Euryarchaeota archaeon]|nr:arginase [Euryarchaeota archaeon]